MTIEFKENEYTLIGKYACCFTEVCIKILEKTSTFTGLPLKRNIHMFFEDPYEFEIEKLKKKLPRGSLATHEVTLYDQNTTSPCIFFGERFIGGFQELQSYLNQEYEMELNENASDFVIPAEVRIFNHINTSPNTFIKVGILDEEHEDYGPHYLNIELYSVDLPLSTKRFLTLAQGSNNDQANPGYNGTYFTRIQKNDFLQIGKIDGLQSDYPVLNDEHFIFDHSSPGMVGFVGGKTTHTNKTEFYITLAPIPSFDKLYVVFGRVVEGLSFLKKISEKQEAHNLLPCSKLRIHSMKPFVNQPTEEFLRRQEEDASRRPHMKKFETFNNRDDIEKFVSNFKREIEDRNYVKGPEIVEIRNLTSNDDLYILAELPLSHVHSITFKDCKFHAPSQAKVFKQNGFFMNVLHWEFYGCVLTKEILKTFFINKFTKPAQSLVIEPVGDGIELFKILIKWKKLEQITKLAFIGSKIGKDELELFQTSNVFSKLEHFDFSHTKFYDEGLIDFVTKFNNKKIKGIYLQSTGITNVVAKALLKNKHLGKLECLDLSNNFGMDSAVQLLAESKHICSLRELYLRNTYLTIHSLYEYVCSQNFGTIEKLDVSNNFSLKDDFAVALIDRPFIRKLSFLNLDNCDISNETIKHLSDNRHLKNLRVLDVSNNRKVTLVRLIEEMDSPKFLQNLSAFHIANTTIDDFMIGELRAEFRIYFVKTPIISKDFSDMNDHVKEIKEKSDLPSETMILMREAFNEIDTDKSGKISVSELKALVEKVLGEKVPQAIIQETIKLYDSDKNGTLEFVEFQRLCYDCMNNV